MSNAPLNPLAQAANDALAKDCPVVLDMLSARGKRSCGVGQPSPRCWF